MRGKQVQPGEQIAYNKTMHGTIQLYENEQGEYIRHRIDQVVIASDADRLQRGAERSGTTEQQGRA